MSGQDVGEKPYHKAERLGEDADDLDRRHQRHRHFKPCRHVRPKNVLPVMLVAEQVDNEECEERQHKRHSDVASDVRSSREERDDSHQVVDEYEEERCQQVRRVPSVVRSYTALDNIVLNHGDKHLHQAYTAFGSLLTGIVPSVPPGGSKHDEQQQRAIDHQTGHVLGDGKVPRPYLHAVRCTFDNLVLVLASRRSDVEPLILSVLQMLRTEDMDTVPGFAHNDHRQRNADRMAIHGGDVPLIRVTDVTVEVLIHVEAATLPFRGQGQRNQKAYEYVNPLSHLTVPRKRQPCCHLFPRNQRQCPCCPPFLRRGRISSL